MAGSEGGDRKNKLILSANPDARHITEWCIRIVASGTCTPSIVPAYMWKHARAWSSVL